MMGPALQVMPEHEVKQHVNHRTAIIYNDTEDAINGGKGPRQVRPVPLMACVAWRMHAAREQTTFADPVMALPCRHSIP